MEQVDPKRYGLPPRTVVMKRGAQDFVLVIHRKSRIIMKDAQAILKKAEKIQAQASDASLIVETNAPVCSKSTQFLQDNGIVVKKLSEN
jgi:hypothetical protein